MDKVLAPRESGKFIAMRSSSVKIVEENIEMAAKVLLEQMTEAKYSMKTWKTHKLHPKVLNEATLNWIFVVDCLNFSFWVKKEKKPYQVEYNGEIYSDYEALCAVVNRALEEGVKITSPEYYKDITIEEARNIFRSDTSTEIPLIERRVAHLQEAGKILNERFDNSIGNLISTCNNSAVEVVNKIASLFSSFRDVAIYDGQHVSLYKRVQIFVADVWACFEGHGYGRFDDINELTMFADYRVPQCLQFLGILRYSDELKRRIDNDEEILPGSKEEVEIRGCSIHTVECLRNLIEKRMDNNLKADAFEKKNLNSVIIDFYLWDYATLNADKMILFPEHRTRTYFY